MQIFYGGKDVNYNNPNRYAYLNWRFDDSMGANDRSNPCQAVNDNFEMGKAYVANAVLSLSVILHSGNLLNMADTFIFPVLFDAWHGIELWLKSSISAIYLMSGNKNKIKSNHNIYQYIDLLKAECHKMNLYNTEKIALTDVSSLIEEFKRVGAHFDFARYSFDNRGEYQFYNAPLGDNKQWQKESSVAERQTVPNTCVELHALFELLLGVALNFRDFVEYLTLLLTEGGTLTDESYERHLKICKKSESTLDSQMEEKGDPIQQIMNFISLNIL